MWLLRHPWGFLLEMCNQSLPAHAPALDASCNTPLCKTIHFTPLLTVWGTCRNWSFENKKNPATAINDSAYLIFRCSATCLTQKHEFGIPNVPATCPACFAGSPYLALEMLSKVTPVHTQIECRTHRVPELRFHPSPPNWPAVQHRRVASSAMGMLRVWKNIMVV